MLACDFSFSLFELIIAGELGKSFFGNCGSCGLQLKKVKARVAMDTENATEALETNLPIELAEKIVASAVSEHNGLEGGS